MPAATSVERIDPAVPAARVEASPARPSPSVVFAEHGAYVMRVVRYLGVADREVMDVAQEVFLHAFAKLDGWEPRRSAIRTWLYGFCVRVVANHRRLRRHTREALGDDADLRESGAPGQEDAVAMRETRARLLAALDALSEDQRAVTVLHAVEELPMSEVVAILEIPLQTGYSRYEAARRALRARLGEGGTDGGT